MKRLSLLIAIPVAATVLTGCFNNSDSTGNDGATIGLAFAPVASMSPYSDDAVLASRMGVGETLVTLGANGDIMPSLAESWSDDSPRSVTFHLRSAKFHDGKPLTAQAAATSLTHAWNATNRPKALGKANLTFEASDDHTLKVTSEKDDPILIQRFADPGTMILSPDAFTGDAKKDGKKNNGKDAEAKGSSSDAAPDLVKHGTGPFSLDKKASSTQADLKANDDYWGGKPKLNTVTVKFMTDASARTAAFRSGEVQLATAIPTSQVSEIEKSAGDIKSTPLPRAVLLHLNTKKGVFTDPGLRAAAREAINSKAITDSVFEGKADAAADHLFNPAEEWARTPEDASKSVVPATQPSQQKIKLATWTERGELPEVASIVADQLRHAGFVVDVTTKDYDSLESSLLYGQFDAVIGSSNYLIGAADPVSYLQSDYTCDGTYNLSQLCDPEIDEQISRADATSDLNERRTLAAEAGARIVADNAVIPVAYPRGYIAMKGMKDVSVDSFERQLLTAKSQRD